MSDNCKQLHLLLKNGYRFDFKSGKDFRKYINNIKKFPI